MRKKKKTEEPLREESM